MSIEKLQAQIDALTEANMEMAAALDDLGAKFSALVQNHNDLVEAVNDNTEFRAVMIEEAEIFSANMGEIEALLEGTEIVFTPSEDILRDKKKDH